MELADRHVFFRLIYGDHDLVLPLTFEPHIEERLVQLIGDSEPAGRSDSDLSCRITRAISALFEGVPVPPTEKQVQYAVKIAQGLELELPAIVLRDRRAMHQFISAHADTFKKTRRSRVW